MYMTASVLPHYTLNLDDAAAKRIASKLSDEDRLAMKEWLVAAEIPESEIDIANTEKLLDQWVNNYDPAQTDHGDDECQAKLLYSAQ